MSKSSSEPQDASAAITSTPGEAPKKFWEFADLGFDTAKKLWFIQFYNQANENVGTYFANDVTLDRGKAVQYQWKDAQGRPFWHVRERFFATDIASFSIDPAGGKIMLTFAKEDEGEDQASVPPEFSYLLYAYHLSSKDGGRAPMGFIEFYDSSGALLRRLENRWIVIEGLRRKTVGEFPKIRMRAESGDVGTIMVTQTVVVVQGKPAEA